MKKLGDFVTLAVIAFAILFGGWQCYKAASCEWRGGDAIQGFIGVVCIEKAKP